MAIDKRIIEKKEEIQDLAERYGAYNVRIFGSAAQGPVGAESDIDFLVDLEPDRSLFDLGGLLMELEELLGSRVDILTEKGLHWYIRDRVIAEAVRL